jgi:hypothetical protein
MIKPLMKVIRKKHNMRCYRDPASKAALALRRDNLCMHRLTNQPSYFISSGRKVSRMLKEMEALVEQVA